MYFLWYSSGKQDKKNKNVLFSDVVIMWLLVFSDYAHMVAFL